LPYAAANPTILDHDQLRGVDGKTYCLANLATFGITGQMLARAGVAGSVAWTTVIAHLLAGVDEGWGRWIEGIVDEDDEPMEPPVMDSDDEEDEVRPAGPSTRRPKQLRAPLPSNISSKLRLLASQAHLQPLLVMVTSPSAKAPTSALVAVCELSAQLLRAFRGTAKWELVLDSLLAGTAGRQLVKRIWREGIRGRWSASADQGTWERLATRECIYSFALTSDPHIHALRLLSHLMNHFLLLSPDDEFFSPAVNPLSMDEVVELSTIWRDLAFWGYMSGVASGDSPKKGTEEDRSLFTRGVTRLTERK
jgi:ubiquitin-protein ligase E3 C